MNKARAEEIVTEARANALKNFCEMLDTEVRKEKCGVANFYSRSYPGYTERNEKKFLKAFLLVDNRLEALDALIQSRLYNLLEVCLEKTSTQTILQYLAYYPEEKLWETLTKRRLWCSLSKEEKEFAKKLIDKTADWAIEKDRENLLDLLSKVENVL